MKTFIIALIAIFLALNIKAQGCSDAGFCTVNSIKSEDKTDSLKITKHQFKSGFSFGEAKNSVIILSPYLEYSINWNKSLASTIKVLYAIHHGELAVTQGLSDAIISFDYKPLPKFKIIGGFKLPFNRADISYKSGVLPMSYQTSLGTFDLILGANYVFQSIVATIAYQQPVIQNKNTFLNNNYESNSIYSKYYSTNNYYRNSDILIRLSNSIKFKNPKWFLITSILPIYHLGNDSYINQYGQKTYINGSEGLTLNLNAFLKYKINENNSLEFSAGAPVISRKTRPDGLSQFSIGLEYLIKF